MMKFMAHFIPIEKLMNSEFLGSDGDEISFKIDSRFADLGRAGYVPRRDRGPRQRRKDFMQILRVANFFRHVAVCQHAPCVYA